MTVVLVGNPKPRSRTLQAAVLVAERLTGETPDLVIDLAELGPGLLDWSDPTVADLVAQVQAADLLVVASPTYKATYSGLLKSFLDRFGTGSLAGKRAVPILLGGAPNHQLAVDVHFTPLLLELGASVPVRGLFVLEADVPGFGEFAAGWAAQHGPVLTAS